MVAYCGLVCDSCPIHLATLEQDKSLRQKMRISIARIAAEKYVMNLQPEEITDCDGCRADTGRLFSGCRKCEIRKCAILKNIESCALCTEFACVKLIDLFNFEPDARNHLIEIRNKNSIKN